jgi:SAM-dependent methyltransferase
VSTEYVNDVPYVRQFIADLSPGRLRLVAALNGLTPPPGDEFDYCELGCAHGDTLAALAAAHPQGRFLGIDISGTHVASAKRLARDGGLENIGFLERDFADLVDEDVGDFDYVVAHGVLSWVSPEKRKALMEFARAKLKPGGLLFVSYNAMPGWASVEPLRQLLLSPVGEGARDGAGEGASLERARRGVEFAQAMERAGAEYFAKNPAASEMLATMAKAGLPYVIHEYLHEHWVPMYFARVAWEMAAHDLHFAGVQPLFMNFRDTAVPEGLERLFAPANDRVTFESLKDFAVNEFFRRDVYVKGSAHRPSNDAQATRATTAYLDSTPWGTLASALPDERRVTLPHRTVDLAEPVVGALFAALTEGATALPELAQRSELAGFGLEKLRDALRTLLVAELVFPMREATRSAAVEDGVFALPSVYNQLMLRRLSGDTPLLMTSTVAGTAFPISTLEALAISVLTEVAPPQREQWVRDFVGRQVLRLKVGDRVFEDRADQRRIILEAVETLRLHRLAKLVELGVLAR